MQRTKPLQRKPLLTQTKPLRRGPMRRKPCRTQPTAAQKRYHGTLRRDGPEGPLRPCQCGCGRPGDTIHHILASAPGKVGRRDHWLVVRLNSDCHNGRRTSVHLLGSEEAFLRETGVDLVAIAVRNRDAWEAKNV